MPWPKGRPQPAETRAKIAATLKGHPVTKATRRKMAAAKVGNQNGLGHTVSAEARKRIGAAKLGKRFKLGKKDGPLTILRKRGAALAQHGRPVLPSPSPGIVGFVPDYRANAVVFFRP